MYFGPLVACVAQPLTEISAAVTEDLRTHVRSLRERGAAFYGYALVAAEREYLYGVTPVYNTEADLVSPPSGMSEIEHRLHVDEWKHWDRWTESVSGPLVERVRREFAGLAESIEKEVREKYERAEEESDSVDEALEEVYDDLEDRLCELRNELGAKLHDAFLEGFAAAKAEGIFGEPDPYLVIWVSDSSEKIMAKSVRRLCSPELQAQFFEVFRSLNR